MRWTRCLGDNEAVGTTAASAALGLMMWRNGAGCIVFLRAKTSYERFIRYIVYAYLYLNIL